MTSLQQPIAPHLIRPLRRPSGPEPILEGHRGAPVHDVWAVMKRRWRVVATTTTILVGAAAAYCVLATPRYIARSLVLIESKAPQVLNGQQLGGAQDPFTSAKYDYYQTQFQLLRSPSLARRVIAELGLVRDARFHALPETAPAEGADPISPSLVASYLRELTVTPIRGTRLVAVEFESVDPDLAADVANAHARYFVRGGIEQLYGAVEQVRTFLEGKLAELQPHMQEAETKLLRFQSQHQLLPVDLGKDIASERLMDISRRLTAAEAELIGLEAQYRLVHQRDFDGLPAVLANALIQKLREEYDKLEVEYALLAQKFRPTYPRLRELSGQLGHARELLKMETAKVVAGVEANYLAAQKTVEELRGELDAQRTALLDRKDAESEFLSLTREAETTRSLYNSLLARVKDLAVTGGADTSNISVAEPASPPQWPSSPETRFNLALSLVTGLLLGTGLAFLRDFTDRSVRDAQDLHHATGLRTLAVVPDFDAPGAQAPAEWMRVQAGKVRRLADASREKLARKPASGKKNGKANGHGKAIDGTIIAPPALLLGTGHMPLPAEAYRTLRTSLLLSRAASPRVLVVTSATSGEGKTTTAVNSAAALAGCGARVLLIDGDLRLPRCHQTLGLSGEPGLAEYLAGEVTAEPIMLTRVPGLSFLAAGRQSVNPTELLTSGLLAKLLRESRERFDYIVIDSPPILAVSDGLLLANLADGVILVAERGRTRADHLQLAVQRLHETGALPLGAVLNRGEIEREYYRYGYYGTGRPAALDVTIQPESKKGKTGSPS